MSDAWAIYNNLKKNFTKEWKVTTVTIRAEAHKRAIFLYEDGPSHRHNVNTMREVAAAIEEACSYVEACNPVWAMKDLDDE